MSNLRLGGSNRNPTKLDSQIPSVRFHANKNRTVSLYQIDSGNDLKNRN